MRLYMINLRNPLVSLVKKSRWRKYRVWKPLGLLILAGLTPPAWEIKIIDENLSVPDYEALPRPDLVGITAFTSQATRAYELAGEFRDRGVPTVMGGIHATMCLEEATECVDSVVTGEAESVWPQVLQDARRGHLRPVYAGEHLSLADVPPARNDLLTNGYAFGSIQTTRGCPLDCGFCSVSAFNGKLYRQRPIEKVMAEFRTIRERLVLIVDDNLIGTSPRHIARAKDLFRAMIHAKLHTKWICQATINIAEDDELLALAAKAGCKGVFIGFESPTDEGLAEIGKKFNMLKGRDFTVSVRRIQRHKILVVGSFIMGLDTDERGIGKRIAEAAERYGLDLLNVLLLTPLPGTRVWQKMKSQGRIAADSFPEDWKYFTLTFPVARYKHLSWAGIIQEMDSCDRRFYSRRRILYRIWCSFWRRRGALRATVGNLSFRYNLRTYRNLCKKVDVSRGRALDAHIEERASHSEASFTSEELSGSSFVPTPVASQNVPYSSRDSES